MFNQIARWNLDCHLAAGNSVDVCPGDARIKQACRKFIGNASQLFNRQGTANDDIRHTIRPPRPPGHGRFGVLWQIGDGIEGVLHIGAAARHVPTGFELYREACAPFGGLGANVGHPFDRLQHGANDLNNGAIHIFCASPGPANINADIVDHDVGKELRAHLRDRRQPRDQHDDKQKICRRFMAGKIPKHPHRLNGQTFLGSPYDVGFHPLSPRSSGHAGHRRFRSARRPARELCLRPTAPACVRALVRASARFLRPARSRLRGVRGPV